MVPSFDERLVLGVATYAFELLREVPDLETIYVPIGLGSGICGTIAARDLLGAKARIVGVSSANAPANALSFAAGHPVQTNSAATFADGMATRQPDPDAVALIRKGADRVVTVAEHEIAEAMRLLFETTHNAAEGAGAAALAALASEHGSGKSAGPSAVILSGGNVDRSTMARVLSGETPQV